MAAEDHLFPYDPDDERTGEVNCRFCGEGPLEWLHNGMGWILVDGAGKRHRCKAGAGDFEDLS